MPWAAAIGSLISAGAGIAGAVAGAQASKTNYKFQDPSAHMRDIQFQGDERSRQGEDAYGKAWMDYLKSTDEGRGMLQELGGQYRGVLNGTGGPTQAQLLLDKGRGQTVNEIANATAGAQGDAALGVANLAKTQATGSALGEHNMNDALLHAKEIETAREGLGGVAGGLNSLDLAKAGQAMNQQQFYGKQGLQIGGLNAQLTRGYDTARAGGLSDLQALESGQDLRNHQLEGQMYGGIFNAIGQAASSFGQGAMQNKQMDMNQQYMDWMTKKKAAA